MTDAAADPGSRRTLLVRQLMAHRGQDDELVMYAADGSAPASTNRRLRYGDRRVTLFLEETERDRLDDLLDDYPVFKLDAPATRKADEAVYVSAVADPKHLADFIEASCRRVYGLPESYRLRVE